MGWVANATPGRFTPRKYNRYPLHRRLGGHQGRSGRVRKIPPPHRDSIPRNNNNNNIQRTWNVKARVIPVIIGATGTISKSFRKYVSDIPGKHDVKELQKTAILGTAHILRKVLTWKNERANAETRNRGTINNKDRIAATMYPLGTWIVSGICVWIPCIKETMMMMMMMIIIIIKV